MSKELDWTVTIEYLNMGYLVVFRDYKMAFRDLEDVVRYLSIIKKDRLDVP